MASSGFQRSSTAEKSTGQDSEKQDFNAMLREAGTFRPFFWGLGLVIWTILDLCPYDNLRNIQTTRIRLPWKSHGEAAKAAEATIGPGYSGSGGRWVCPLNIFKGCRPLPPTPVKNRGLLVKQASCVTQNFGKCIITCRIMRNWCSFRINCSKVLAAWRDSWIRSLLWTQQHIYVHMGQET